MSDLAYQFPERSSYDSKRDYLAAKEIFVEFWISRLKLEHELECKFGIGADATKLRERNVRLIHLERLRHLIRSRKSQRVLLRVEAKPESE